MNRKEQLKEFDKYIKSPFNYIGNKHRLLAQIAIINVIS